MFPKGHVANLLVADKDCGALRTNIKSESGSYIVYSKGPCAHASG